MRMAESTKVRLVRCPTCDNLLPELAGYSVYQCGGCGALLRAGEKNPNGDTLSEKSDDGVVNGGIEAQVKDFRDQGMVDFSDASDADVKSYTESFRSEEKKQPEMDDSSAAGGAMDQTKGKSGKLVVETGVGVNGDRDNATGEVQLISVSQNGTSRESWRSGHISSLHSSHGYRDEGPLSYNLNSSYGYREKFWNRDGCDGDGRVQYLENDRAELLRKVKELKQQLSRSALLTDKPSEVPSVNERMTPPNPLHVFAPPVSGGSSASNGVAMQFYARGSHGSSPPYFSRHPESFSYSNGHQEALQGFLHPSMQKSTQIPAYGDQFGHQLPRIDPHPVPGQYQQPVRRNFSGHCFDTGPDQFYPYPSNAAFHPPACSCYHCYNRHHGVPPPLLQPRTRWPSNDNSEMGGFDRFNPRKVVLASSSKHCNPVGGGAPFVTCYNCFEVLKLPKVLLSDKKQQKLQCGSCSTIIKFSVLNKKLIIRNTEAEQASNVMIEESLYPYGTNQRTKENATFSSNEYGNSGYGFQAIDPDLTESSMGQGLNPREIQRLSSYSPNLAEEDDNPDALPALTKGMDSVEQTVRAILSSPQPGSPLQHYSDHSSHNRDVNRLGKESHSSHSDQEKIVTNKANARQNSMNEASTATEMDVSFNGYPNTDVFQEEDNPSKSSKGVESFFANFIKKSLKDISKVNRTDERGRSNVSVNGHVIPNKLVKRAEKLAGPVLPGRYWYDPKAGFWGLTGGPCLGMIPSSIEEFNYPMPEDCSGGDTGVFVNGRELHQKDLDLLANRGLPTETDRSYIVSTNGGVVDEDTGEELESLGKLAPTVERAKRGFGMKIPMVAAS